MPRRVAAMDAPWGVCASEATVARLLKRHRIRRIDATGVLDRLRAPPVVVAAGTTEAATAHIKAVAAPRA